MFWMIYTFYVDSLLFIIKNRIVVFPFFFYVVGYFLLGQFFEGFLNFLFLIVYYCLVETYATVVVYKEEMLFDSSESAWQIINRFSGKILLLTVTEGFALAFFLVVYIVLFYDNGFEFERPFFGFIEFFFGTAYLLSLRHLLYHDPILVMDSMKAGVKDLYKNFPFYLLLVLFGKVLAGYPSILFPVSWAIVPFLPIAELSRNIAIGDGINWISIIINPILFAITSIAFTYAFLTMKRKEKHAS